MEEIYYKLFGTSIITNNDMPTWIVHGYITHTKGHPINWAQAAESTSKEKASRDIVKNGRLGQVKKEYSTLCFDSGGSMNPNELRSHTLAPNGGSLIPNEQILQSHLPPTKLGLEDGIIMDPNNVIGQSFYLINKCPNGMAVDDTQKVTKFLQLKKDLHIICKSKIKSFATNQVVANKKLFKMEHNRDDRNCVVEEAQAKLTKAKQVLVKLKKQDLPIIDAICHPFP